MPNYVWEAREETPNTTGIVVEYFQEKLMLKEIENLAMREKIETYLRGRRNHLCKGKVHRH